MAMRAPPVKSGFVWLPAVPVTKHNYLIQQADSLPSSIEEAFYLASSGRKGPVLIDIPKDVLVYTLMGKAAFPNLHKNCLGLIGYHGRVEANTAILRSDLIIAVGTRFGDRST
ncbi:hypothetical protein ES708_15108 [subsurface metagenome]